MWVANKKNIEWANALRWRGGAILKVDCRQTFKSFGECFFCSSTLWPKRYIVSYYCYLTANRPSLSLLKKVHMWAYAHCIYGKSTDQLDFSCRFYMLPSVTALSGPVLRNLRENGWVLPSIFHEGYIVYSKLIFI